MEMLKTFFQSPDGDLSPKRVFGSVIVVAALVLLIVGSIITNADMQSTGKYMMVAGCGLLGITALEHIGRG